ncbi:MAG: FAD-binding protein [Treponema sp.]|nr:FAD-binding protein [Treponema sp.]
MKRMWKFLAAALTLVAALGFTASCATMGRGVSFTPGTYRATALGYIDPITVEVEVSANRIERVEVVQHNETAGLAYPALFGVPAQIVQHQTLNVDVVVGATVTRFAILAAVRDAVAQAGANPDDLMAPVRRPRARAVTRNVDVVVVGGGGAGIAAAITALQEGATSVILVERTTALGGNTLAAGAGFAAWNAVVPEWLARQQSVPGQEATLRSFLAMNPATFSPGFREALITLQGQIQTYLAGNTAMQFDSVEFHMVQTYVGSIRTDLEGNRVYSVYDFVRIMAEGSAPAVHWVQSVGGRFGQTVRGQPQHALAEPVGSMWRRGMGPEEHNYTSWFDPLGATFRRLGGEIMFSTHANSLIIQGGEVRGINATNLVTRASVTIRARSVVLATGGFAANRQMIAEFNNFWENFDPGVGTTNVNSAQGDGIRMAQAAGAGVTQMGIAQLMPIGFIGTGALATGHGNNVMYVGPDGRRFVNETSERDTLVNAAFSVGGVFFEIRRQQDQVHNQLRFVGDGSGRVFAANTLQDLAAQIGVPPAALADEVARFNVMATNLHDPDFGRTVFHNTITGPYMVRVLTPSTHYTNGGLTTNLNAQVLDAGGNVIPNLWAAGEIMGGIHGGNRLGGNAVAEAFVFGRIAGSGAAANVR